MSEHQRGALDAIEEIATGLDAHIRAAVDAMLAIQDVTRGKLQKRGTWDEEVIKSVIEMSLARGYFDGLVKAWELVKLEKYPLELIEEQWLEL